MEREFSFDHLTPTKFEAFCFDLIKELPFKSVNWRKGTGKPTSPADQGRDIEALRVVDDIDGQMETDTWFFDSKQTKAGLPPDKLHNSLTWASAERPAKLVIMCSNYLSNSCKEFLKKYTYENKPTFKIKVWELDTLRDFSIGKIKLLKKYKLSQGLEFADYAHPLHIKYTLRPSLNTLDKFFEILDKYDKSKRELLLQWLETGFLTPRFGKPVTGKETLGELQLDITGYEELKTKAYELSKVVPDAFIVKALNNAILDWALSFGDPTKLDTTIKVNQRILKSLENNTLAGKKDAGRAERLTDKIKAHLKNLPNQTKEYYALYVEYCDIVLSQLMEENIFKGIGDI